MVDQVRAPSPPESPLSAEPDQPLLGRLNQRGFRLIMLADLLMLVAVTVGSMLIRFGAPPWPTYPTSLYVLSFSVAVAIFMASLYFGGMYEREPRLGAPPALPRAMRQTLAAGGLVALLTLALTGVSREFGILGARQVSLTMRALPFPIPLVPDKGQWRFDTEAGIEEVLNRRIGQNELTAIAVMREYVEAQVKYASVDRDGDASEWIAFGTHPDDALPSEVDFEVSEPPPPPPPPEESEGDGGGGGGRKPLERPGSACPERGCRGPRLAAQGRRADPAALQDGRSERSVHGRDQVVT